MVLPLSLPGVFAAVILTFVPATGDYVNAAVLGGPGDQMVGNIIQSKFLTEANYPQAAALSVILMLGMLVLRADLRPVAGHRGRDAGRGSGDMSAVTVDPQAPPQRAPHRSGGGVAG